jgi:hypothetical protein
MFSGHIAMRLRRLRIGAWKSECPDFHTSMKPPMLIKWL